MTPSPWKNPALQRPAPSNIGFLYFDGGSGAVLVQVEGTTLTVHLHWIGSRYYPEAVTNNQMEYQDLLLGLHEAHKHRLAPLYVIGDSQMIIEQHKQVRQPRNPLLRQVYNHTRRLSDLLGVVHWVHHYRTHNKMADAAVNSALDHTTTSIGCRPFPLTLQAVETSLHNDITPHFAAHRSHHTHKQSPLTIARAPAT
jgi:ribonuclease HI